MLPELTQDLDRFLPKKALSCIGPFSVESCRFGEVGKLGVSVRYPKHEKASWHFNAGHTS